MIHSPISQPSDHPLSPTLENGNRLAGGAQAATDDPLSPQLDNDDDDDEEEDARYNRINPRPARDMSLSSTYSESDTIYNDQETDSQPNPPSSSKRNSHLGSNSNGLRNGAMGKGKGKGWIAGTASTERLTTSSSESMASSGGGGNANGGKPRIASAASSIDGYSNTNSNAGSDDEEKNVQAVSRKIIWVLRGGRKGERARSLEGGGRLRHCSIIHLNTSRLSGMEALLQYKWCFVLLERLLTLSLVSRAEAATSAPLS